MTPDLLTTDFDFDLPAEYIAQVPAEPRDTSKLLHVAPQALADHHVFDLPNLLRDGDLLVLNDTKVIPARLYGMRGSVRVELLLHKKEAPQTWVAFARPGKRLRTGDTIFIAPDFTADVIDKRVTGEVVIKFSAGDDALPTLLHEHGEPPLPPYIRRERGEAKKDMPRYQTIYAAREGAVAAPTAGLHFTPELMTRLAHKNILHTTVTLHVGAGTFLPVKADRIHDHKMHSEWGEISQATADLINKARSEGRRIVAVGTTSLRLLESAADENGHVRPFRGDTDIFITPGYRIKTAEAMLTNFHLPKSTLFMLVCAFAGMDVMREAYKYAIVHGYRFYSYGDATLLERPT